MESSFQDFVLNDLNRRKDSTRRQGNNMRGSDSRSSCHLPTNLSGLDQKHYCTSVFLPMLAARCSASCYSCFFFFSSAGGVLPSPVLQLFLPSTSRHIYIFQLSGSGQTLFFSLKTLSLLLAAMVIEDSNLKGANKKIDLCYFWHFTILIT